MDQRTRLLQANQRLDDSSKRLQDSHRVALESGFFIFLSFFFLSFSIFFSIVFIPMPFYFIEEIGAGILSDLHGQREQIVRTRDNVLLSIILDPAPINSLNLTHFKPH